MKREIVLAVSTFAVAASGGFLLGRKYPARHYESWKTGGLLYDTSTGKLCDPTKPLGFSLDNYLSSAATKTPDPYEKYRAQPPVANAETQTSDVATLLFGSPNSSNKIPPCD